MKSFFLHIIKYCTLLISIKISVLFGYSFIGEDLGVDLYKKIDSGVVKLDNQFLEGSINNSSNGSLAKQVSRELQSNGFPCNIQSLKPDELDLISSGEDLGLIRRIISNSCNHKGPITLGQISKLQSISQNYREGIRQSAQQKSELTKQLGGKNIYANGNTNDSSFDLINDFKEIYAVLFSKQIEYKGSNNIDTSEISDYLNGKYKQAEQKAESVLNQGINGDNTGTENAYVFADYLSPDESHEHGHTSSHINSLHQNDVQSETYYVGDNLEDLVWNTSGIDDTQYVCENHESGLDTLGIQNLISHINSTGFTPNGENNLEGIDTIIDTPLDTKLEYLADISTHFITTPESNTQTNSSGECDGVFCIDVDFIVNNHDLLGGGKTTSIESIIEQSNKHLKPFASSSLIQGKMTTNNFETPFKNLDLSKIFNMNIVTTSQAPPIANFENIPGRDKKKPSGNQKQQSKSSDEPRYKKILCQELARKGINCKRENDLSILSRYDEEQKNIQNSAEMTLSELIQNSNAEQSIHAGSELLGNLGDDADKYNAQMDEGDDLHTTIVKLDSLVKSLYTYSYDLSEAVKQLNEIPIQK